CALTLIRRNEQDFALACKHGPGHMSGNWLDKRNRSLLQREMHILQVELGVANLINFGAIEAGGAKSAIKSDGLRSRWRSCNGYVCILSVLRKSGFRECKYAENKE